MTCPHCGESARFVNYRPKNFVSLLGEIAIDRAYYHCAACCRGDFPWDRSLRLGPVRLTPAAEEVVTLLGIQDSFVQVVDRTLTKTTGLKLSESTVQRTTESAGEALDAALEAELNAALEAAKPIVAEEQQPSQGPPRPAAKSAHAKPVHAKPKNAKAAKWDWNKDSEGKTCAYVSVDATGILMQGPNGGKVDGRMVTVGMIFNPQPRQGDATSMPCQGVRYLAGFYGLDELGPLLRLQGGQVGMNDAERWIALTDAGSGLEEFMRVYFPRAVCILDFQHPIGYLTPLAQALRSTDEERQALLSNWCHMLKHDGGEKMLATLESLEKACVAAGAGESWKKAQTYFRNHKGRMNYPEYLKKGWQIGTGAVESACKRLINQRLGMGGMRWCEYGGDGVAHLRALSRSDPDQWDAFWACYRLAA